MPTNYDIIVIGGGHAGVEAAWVAARMGASVALVTMQREAIGRMSCNPAIGGIGKGQIVTEVDALGGLMALATDRAGIQFRMLNRSKGPAVWAPRAQADRDAYPRAVQDLLGTACNLTIVEGSVERLQTEGNYELRITNDEDAAGAPPLQRWDTRIPPRVDGVSNSALRRITGVTLADGRTLRSPVVIVTTGTFLRALMHCGNAQIEGGRIGEASAVGLSASLRGLGFELGRLKTGTPPRIHRDSIDYSVCERQPGDDDPTPFSFMNDRITQRQIDCWVTWTNVDVHELIRANLHRAPMYSGQIQSTGPRYCPSIEDKVVRFADKERHQIFLEPEGYDNERIYCNGISTSTPADVQEAFVRRVPGLERAEILQHGYAVEYDFVPTRQTKLSLESKPVAGLFFAGQINGTSGYEEAAGQGIIAGINAVRLLQRAQPFVLGRDEAYIGVMIDDLITRPPSEPYRMFTSRAEYRLLLRADNADQRLTSKGRELGAVADDRWDRFVCKKLQMDQVKALADSTRVDGQPLAAWLRRPDATVEQFAEILHVHSGSEFDREPLRQVLLDAKYSGYVDRQAEQIERFRKLESMTIPGWVDYAAMPDLRCEARENLARVAPQTLGQARRISGISPADLTVLWVYLTGRHRENREPTDRSPDSIASCDFDSLDA